MPMRKKPAIYLAVILPLLMAGVIPVAGLETLYANIAGIPRAVIPQQNALLIGLPTILLWFPLSLFLANCIVFAVPPLCKVAETYATETQGPGFIESQRTLGKITLGMAAFCVPLVIIGFVV